MSFPEIVCLVDLWMFPSSNFLCAYKCIYTHSLPGGGGVYGLNLGNASTRLPFPPEPLSTAYSHPVWGSLDTFTVFWKLVNNIFWNAFNWLLLSILDLSDNISLGQSILLLDLQCSSTDVIHSGSLDFPSSHISGWCFPQYRCSLSSSGCTEFVQSPMYKAYTISILFKADIKVKKNFHSEPFKSVASCKYSAVKLLLRFQLTLNHHYTCLNIIFNITN